MDQAKRTERQTGNAGGGGVCVCGGGGGGGKRGWEGAKEKKGRGGGI